MLAIAISGAVILWQLLLGAIQVVAHAVGGPGAGAIALIAIAIWTFAMTGSGLTVLQLVVQGIIAAVLFSKSSER